MADARLHRSESTEVSAVDFAVVRINVLLPLSNLYAVLEYVNLNNRLATARITRAVDFNIDVPVTWLRRVNAFPDASIGIFLGIDAFPPLVHPVCTLGTIVVGNRTIEIEPQRIRSRAIATDTIERVSAAAATLAFATDIDFAGVVIFVTANLAVNNR